jgi:hypothetical protein
MAAALLAVTSLSHIIFGYAVFVSALLWSFLGPRQGRAERFVRIAMIIGLALVLLAWFLIPLLLSTDIVNHSRWEDPKKWDSYGARFILTELAAGRLLDAGRFPSLSILLGAGAVVAIFVARRDPRAVRLLGLCAAWLLLFFGRETWGHLMLLAGVPADMHLHRLQAVFEISAILLGAFGVAELTRRLAARNRALAAICALSIAALVVSIGADRARYLQQNEQWGEENLAAYSKDSPDLNAALAQARSILGERPGRVSAGLAASWGGQYKVGSVPVYAFLTRDHFDQSSFLYHSMSKTADIMVLREENNRSHDIVFGIRAVVAPSDRQMPDHMKRRSVNGRFAVYEASPEGYFGIVDVAAYYAGPPATNHEISSAWLKSSLLTSGLTISLDDRFRVGSALQRWEALPSPRTELRGRVISETKSGELYQARIEVNQPGYALIKITWSPDLAATVDGKSAPVIHVTPGFGAVPVSAGQHDVSVSYDPGLLKPSLFILGIAGFVLGCWVLGDSRVKALEAHAALYSTGFAERFMKPGMKAAAVLIVLGVVALHPLFRGKLISGHDALEYPPRVMEMARALSDGHIPPVWAPDLGAGHGQPLFLFSPPFPYWIALLFRTTGIGLTDSIQLSLAFLFLCGAGAVYAIGRRFRAPEYAAIGGGVAWLFAPYISLDLFVRTAYSEAAGIALAPIALLALLQAMLRPSALRVALAAASVALIQLSHNVVALLMIPAFSIIVLVYGSIEFRRTRAPLIAGVAAIACAIGLSAYFWLPAMMEIQSLHGNRFLEGSFNWRENIVEPLQLLWSPWAYGLSVPGPNDGMSFALGLMHLALGAVGLTILARSRTAPLRPVGVVFGCLTIAAALLSTTWTSWLWSNLPLLHYAQHPWRVLMLPALFLPLLAVFAFERVGFQLSVALIALLVVINLPHTEAKGFHTFDEEYYYPQSIAVNGINTTTHEEFEPRWAEVRPPYSAAPLVGITLPIQVTPVFRRAGHEEFYVTASAPTLVESSTFFFPGWEVLIDGVRADIAPALIRGTMQFQVPAGQHAVSLVLRQTPVRRTALIITMATLLLLAGAAVVQRFRRPSVIIPLL